MIFFLIMGRKNKKPYSSATKLTKDNENGHHTMQTRVSRRTAAIPALIIFAFSSTGEAGINSHTYTLHVHGKSKITCVYLELFSLVTG